MTGEPNYPAAVSRLLEMIGEDPSRPGLRDTPSRVVRSLAEMTAGYTEDPASILDRTFDGKSDELIVVRDIEFVSLCEHHLLPFIGTAIIGYLPNDRVVGLSKLPRVVHCYSRRLQMQERLTAEIAEAIYKHLEPRGVGVILSATHLCMAARGVRTRGQMVTSSLLGELREDANLRTEFLSLRHA